MKGTFIILKNSKLMEYSDYNDIPEGFDNLISFSPNYPPEPHTPEQHAEIETFNDKLKELMRREKM